jgi:hypothetical protein
MNIRSDGPKPKTREDLAAAGYLLSGSAKCKGCGAAIEWWMTPKARRMPFDVLKDGTLASHWDHCPQVKEFRPKAPGTSRLQQKKK